MDDKTLLNTLADILVRNGIDVEREVGIVRLTGDDALAYARDNGWSFGLGLAIARQDIGKLAAAVQAQAQAAGIPVDDVIAEITRRLGTAGGNP